MRSYRFEYDDPYKILAGAVVAYSRPADVIRLLTDDLFIKNYIIKETRGQDFKGPFTDCIIEGILDDKSRMEYMKELDRLAEYYFSKLDKERFRREIKEFLSDCGIVIEECRYSSSTGGSNLSATT